LFCQQDVLHDGFTLSCFYFWKESAPAVFELEQRGWGQMGIFHKTVHLLLFFVFLTAKEMATTSL
jgi:hypothetical protein